MTLSPGSNPFCVTLGKFINLSECQVPHLQNGTRLVPLSHCYCEDKKIIIMLIKEHNT